jgi:phenylalanine-4-hydroxylase
MSSFGETNHAWESRNNLKVFNLAEVMSTPFQPDVIQTKYYILDSIPELERELNHWFERTI